MSLREALLEIVAACGRCTQAWQAIENIRSIATNALAEPVPGSEATVEALKNENAELAGKVKNLEGKLAEQVQCSDLLRERNAAGVGEADGLRYRIAELNQQHSVTVDALKKQLVEAEAKSGIPEWRNQLNVAFKKLEKQLAESRKLAEARGIELNKQLARIEFLNQELESARHVNETMRRNQDEWREKAYQLEKLVEANRRSADKKINEIMEKSWDSGYLRDYNAMAFRVQALRDGIRAVLEKDGR